MPGVYSDARSGHEKGRGIEMSDLLASKAETPTPQIARIATLVRGRLEMLAQDLGETVERPGPSFAKDWAMLLRFEAKAVEQVILAFPSVPAAGLPTGVAQQDLEEDLKQLLHVCTCRRPTKQLPGGGVQAPGDHTLNCVSTIAEHALSLFVSAPAAPPVIEEQKTDLG